MKRVFHQFHIQAFYVRLMCLGMLAVGLYLIILSAFKLNIVMGLIGTFPVIISLYAYITAFNNRIIFMNDIIKVTGNLGKKTERIQFSDEITYSDIEDIKIIYVNKNSIKKTILSTNLGNLQPKLYFEIILNGKESKWLLIGTFSKKQRIKMLEIINSKTGKNFVYDEIEKKDFSIYKKH